MSKAKSKPKKTARKLIVVAHPDDETLFFGGLILAEPRTHWTVICVTDANADGQKQPRQKQFREAMRKLGVRDHAFFDLPDIYERRLDLNLLQAKLKAFTAAAEPFTEVYTHGPIGEYGHPHHQDVCLAVHRFFYRRTKIWGAAHNCAPDHTVVLDAKTFQKKAEVLSRTYFSETERFIGYVPATHSEGFARYDLNEVEALHSFLSGEKSVVPARLKKYAWFRPYLLSFKERMQKRPF